MNMRQTFYISISIFITIIIIGILIPIIFIRDINGLTKQKIDCAKINAYQVLENPIERMLILKTAVLKKEKDVFTVNAYTFFGLKYAIAEIKCDNWSKVIWRRWFNAANNINSEIKRNSLKRHQDELLEKFDFYVKKTELSGKDNFYRDWSIDKPITACEKLIGITAPDERRDDARAMSVLRFRGEQREYDFYFPFNKMDINNYEVGKFYEIDMNNICIYHSVMLDSYHPSQWLEKFIYPESFDEN